MNKPVRRLLLEDTIRRPPPRRDPYIVQMLYVGYVEEIIRHEWPFIAAELSLKDRDFYVINDWCVKELIKQSLQRQGITVFGHYRNDEARCVFDHVAMNLVLPFQTLLKQGSLLGWSACEVQVMVLGTDAMVARTLQITKS